MGKLRFVTDVGSYFVWARDMSGYTLFINLNKHTGITTTRRLAHD